jgi:hypothetical protein
LPLKIGTNKEIKTKEEEKKIMSRTKKTEKKKTTSNINSVHLGKDTAQRNECEKKEEKDKHI